MEPLRIFPLLFLILTLAIVSLKADDQLKNDTAHGQGNVTLDTLSHGTNESQIIKGKHNNEVVFNTSKGRWYYRGKGGGGGGGGGGGFEWGWGGGGGGGSGWGWGGCGYYEWGCRNEPRHVKGKKGIILKKHHIRPSNGDYRMGEFAQCMARTRCKGMRLDCPLHCGGPCLYDCHHMCKAHWTLKSRST